MNLLFLGGMSTTSSIVVIICGLVTLATLVSIVFSTIAMFRSDPKQYAFIDDLPDELPEEDEDETEEEETEETEIGTEEEEPEEEEETAATEYISIPITIQGEANLPDDEEESNEDEEPSEEDPEESEEDTEEEEWESETELNEEEESEAESEDTEEWEEDIIIPTSLPVVTSEPKTLYQRSFLAHLLQTDQTVKRRYVELANYILSYKKVKGKMSWRHDLYRAGRTKLLKFMFKGKTLTLFFALEAEEFAKFRLKRTKAKSCQDTPAYLKIKSERAVRNAKTLIDVVCGENGITTWVAYKDIKVRDFPKDTTENLIARNLIKVKQM